MTFLQPEALFWIGAILLPLALYFFQQKTTRTQAWAAGKFLRAALDRLPARKEKGERNLALLRCLIIFLLCIIFARPVLDFSGTQTRMASGASHAVIVIDDSGSMTFRQGARSSFEEGVDVAARLIRNLDEESSVALCPASGPAAGNPLKFETDFIAARKKLETIRPGENAGDLLPGIRAAVNLLVRQNGGIGEVFVVTDNQIQAWKQVGEVQSLLAVNSGILFHVVGVGDFPENNLAITGLRLSRGVPSAGRSMGCHITVSNFGGAAAENVRVTLKADNLPLADQTFIPLLEPGKSVTVRLFATLPDGGPHSLTAGIPADSLSYDNERSVALEAVKQMNVLIVEGTNVPIAPDRDGYFLANAFSPVPQDQKKNYYLQVDTISSSELDKSVLKPYKLVVLSNVSKFSLSVAQALSSFVEDGGGLVIFPGPNTDLLYYNTDRLFSGLLPARLETPQNAPADQKFITLQKGPFNHPLMSAWRDLSPESLAQVQYKSYFPLTLPVGADKEDSGVILTFADGRPAVVEKKKGDGRVILFNSTATTRWNNLPLHPAFVPLIQSLAGYLTELKEGNLVLAPGEVFARDLGPEFAGKEFRVQGPGVTEQGHVSSEAVSPKLSFGETSSGGVYSVFLANSVRPDFVFAVQTDPKESDLRRIPGRELEVLNHGFGLQTGTRLVTWQKAGHELWMELGLIVLVLAGMEVFLAARLNRKAGAS